MDDFGRARDDGAVVLDVRAPEAFGGAHVPGALNVGAGTSFATWAGTVLPEDARVLLVVDEPGRLWPVTWDLLRIGYDQRARRDDRVARGRPSGRGRRGHLRRTGVPPVEIWYAMAT